MPLLPQFPAEFWTSPFLIPPAKCVCQVRDRKRELCFSEKLPFLNFLGTKKARSKVKRDKGGMPGKSGHRQKLRQAKAFRSSRWCYDFGFVLQKLCQAGSKAGHSSIFPVSQKVLPDGKHPISGFPNFWEQKNVGSKIKREKGPASSRRPWVRCRAMPDPVLGILRRKVPVTGTFNASSDRRQIIRIGVYGRCRHDGISLEPQRFFAFGSCPKWSFCFRTKCILLN